VSYVIYNLENGQVSNKLLRSSCSNEYIVAALPEVRRSGNLKPGT